ncbi:hypothetical protein BaRGS_00005546 [Batillaria attramentaria]|uniref:DEP domain-containing protein n=1 Tax=Batillaria attramentaria TaxID=370345 RepID=A0ABD0LW04_9CAEN
MASSESTSFSSPQTFHLEKTIPLRESKTNIGPFRATEIWNELVAHLKSKVELKRRRHKMRHYDNCFTGTDAVDVILHYLLSDKETFSTDLSREKAVKVCQLLMSKKIFEPVNSRHNDSCKHTFEDSGGNRCSLPLEAVSEEATMYGRDDDRCSLLSHHSHSSSSSSLPSLSEFDPTHSDQSVNLSKEVIEETWREVALAQLTTLIDLTFLDGVLAQDKPSKRQQQHHNLIISNIVAKNWHLPVTQSLFNLDTVGLGEEEDSVIQKAIACMECLPKGTAMLADHAFHRNDSNSKRQAFELLRKHYASQTDTVLPGRFFDLHMAILNLILQRHNRQALEALRLDMVLLPLPVKEELHRLLKFMTALSLDSSLVLDHSDSNEVVVLRAFSDVIFRHKLLAPNLGSILVQFMMQNMRKMFTVPRIIREKVSIKLYHMKTGQNLPDIDTTFCDRVSREEYQRQARDCTQDALISLMNNVLDDTKVPLKEKKHRLKQFQKCYPTLYEEHFSGMV